MSSPVQRFSLWVVLGPRAFHLLAQRRRETEPALSRGPFKKLLAAYEISLVRHCVCFWTRCIRNVCAEKGGGCRWKEKKKQRSKPLFSMFYSVVKTIEQEVLQIVYYISFFAYLARSRLVTTNFHCYISFYTLYEPFTHIQWPTATKIKTLQFERFLFD